MPLLALGLPLEKQRFLGGSARRVFSYRPHDGHTDQMRSLVLAATIARATQRTLLLPPLLRHFDAPSCPVVQQNVTTRWRRPSLSSLLNLTSLGVPYIEGSIRSFGCDAPSMRHRCTVVDPTWLSFVSTGFKSSSVNSPQLHFASLLFSQSLGKALLRRYSDCRFAQWERHLAPTPCRIRYRGDVLARALAVITYHLPSKFVLFAAHVRVLPEAAGKRDPPQEWTARVASLLRRKQQQPPQQQQQQQDALPVMAALWVAADDPAAVLPRAARVVAAVGGAVAVLSRANLSTAELEGVHVDTKVAGLAVDISAALHAQEFAPSPNSGLSRHLVAMRRCEHGDGHCAPVLHTGAGGMASSTACGGELPRTISVRNGKP